MERWDSSYVHQKGGGGGSTNDDDDDDDDDDEVSVADSMETDDTGSDTSDVTDEETASEVDGNWVFNRFLQDIDRDKEGNEDFDIKQRQELFRKVYTDFLIWYHHLRRNTIHKKIMETAKDLHESYDYDKEEAFHAAIEQRKFLLDRIVEDQSSVDGDADEEA